MLSTGDHHRTLTAAGRLRDYLVHVPPLEPACAGWPVVLAFHGGGVDARMMVRFCGLNETADRAGFIVVYPNGTGRVESARTWNAGDCCGLAQREGVDDVQFVELLLADLQSQIRVDPQRIYATGFSNGAMLAYLLADRLSDQLAAIAPVAGPMATDGCRPARGVSICHLHGTRDDFTPYHGGVGGKSLHRADFHSVEFSIQCWVRANGCHPQPRTDTLPERVADGTSVIRSIYSGGRDDSEVVLLAIQNAGHVWPGRASLFSILGKSTGNLDACAVIWEFFEHRRRS